MVLWSYSSALSDVTSVQDLRALTTIDIHKPIQHKFLTHVLDNLPEGLKWEQADIPRWTIICTDFAKKQFANLWRVLNFSWTSSSVTALSRWCPSRCPGSRFCIPARGSQCLPLIQHIDTTHHGTHHCAQKTEGVTNHSSDSKLINTLLNPTFTERFPVLGKINDHFNTFFFFFFLK